MFDQVELKTGIMGFGRSIGRRIFKFANYFISRDSVLSPFVLFSLSLLFPSYRHRKLVPIEWLDESRQGAAIEICPEAEGLSYGPNIDERQQTEEVTLAAINLYRFTNAAVSANSSSVVTNGKAIIERVKGVDLERCDYSSGQIVMHGLRSALVSNKFRAQLTNGFFLGGNGSSNYYHWMVEILVKLKFLDQYKEFDEFPLLVNESIAETKTLMDALVMLAPNRPVFLMGKYDTYLVENLIYINSPNECPFNLRNNYEMRIADFYFRESSIDFLRRNLIRKSLVEAVAGKERIFMARRGSRRNYNQEEIFEILAGYGFRKIFMEDLSLCQQIDLVSNSEMIVGPTGAAWTNLVFCRPGTKGLCWMAEESRGFAGYSNIARIVGADLRYITYRTGAKSTEELYSTNYLLDRTLFSEALSRLMIE